VRLLKTSRALRKANSQTTAAFNEGIVACERASRWWRRTKCRGILAPHPGHAHARDPQRALCGSFWPMMLSVCGLGIAIALRFGGYGVLHTQMTLGALATFLQIVFFIQFPVQELTNSITQIQGAQASAERVQSLLDADTEIEDSPKSSNEFESRGKEKRRSASSRRWDGCPHPIHRISQRRFRVQSRPDVLARFQSSVHPGQSIALVGPTGGGKTTSSDSPADFMSRLPAKFSSTASTIANAP